MANFLRLFFQDKSKSMVHFTWRSVTSGSCYLRTASSRRRNRHHPLSSHGAALQHWWPGPHQWRPWHMHLVTHIRHLMAYTVVRRHSEARRQGWVVPCDKSYLYIKKRGFWVFMLLVTNLKHKGSQLLEE